MLESISKLSNGVNIIIFMWSVTCLLFFVTNRKRKIGQLAMIYLAGVAVMIPLTILIVMIYDTSRYATGLILPFTVFATIFLCDFAKRRHILIRLFLLAYIICTGIIILKMNFDDMSKNHFCYLLAETYDHLDQNGDKNLFKTYSSHFHRISRLSKINKDAHVSVFDTLVDFDITRDYEAYPHSNLFLNIPKENISDDTADLSNLKMIAHIVANEKGTKRQFVYSWISANQCTPVSEDKIPPYEPNLLDNGDFEVLDSAEDSYEKLKSHIADFSLFYNAADESVRTPRFVYYQTEDDLSSLPVFSVSEASAIDGHNSVRIRLPDGQADLFFQKHFSDGKYECSLLVQGSRGTTVRVLRDEKRDGKRKTKHVVSFEIPDNRIYKLTTRFSIDGLGPDDFFLIGARVQNGEACFDDFILRRSESD